MKIPHLILRSVVIVVATFILASCETGPRIDTPAGASRFEIAKAERLLNRGEREAAAKIYWEQAGQVPSPDREQLQIQAVEAALSEETMPLARQYLAMIDEGQLQGPLLVRKRMVEARAALMDQHPELALQALPARFADIAPDYSTEVLDIRAQALLENEQILDSIKARIELNTRLTLQSERARNQQMLWEALGRASAQDVQAWQTAGSDPELRGWLELAQISKVLPADDAALEQQLAGWQSLYPGHPGAPTFTTEIRNDWQALQFRPSKIAVLLSLSGRYAGVTNAVAAGIQTASALDKTTGNKPVVKIYDIAAPGEDLWRQYDKAVLDGAEIVIGPLQKQAVNEIAGVRTLPVPVLLLNYADLADDTSASTLPNLYQFGLLPEDEAKQAAERASADGHQTAVALVPEGDWGARLLTAFRMRFEQLGGTVLSSSTYSPQESDYAEPIKYVLQLNESEARYRALRNKLNREIKFEPHRRQDTDMVFIAASPRQARSLRPQLKFYFAKDLPVYATSHIYAGVENVRKDNDINDIIYCDIPWILNSGNLDPAVRKRLKKNHAKSLRLPRLVALGVDAYRVIPYIKRLSAKPYERFSGLTGNLLMDDNRRIHRELKWAQFVNGKPVLLDTLVANEQSK